MLEDPFTSEVIRSYLASTVREMVKATTRTAYSIVFSEGADFSCALFDGRARCISLESGNPVHMASLPSALQALKERYPEIDEGDVLLTNDPYRGGTHHSDVVVVKPIFHAEKLVAFGINRGHWSDIGGMSAGGFSGAARDVIQEGLIIPPIKLYRRGRLVPELKDLLTSNVRVSDRVWGDLQAQIAAVITAERRVKSLIEKYGLTAVIDGMDYAIAYSKRRFLRGMQAIPDGDYHAVQFMEDDGAVDRPYRIEVHITKKADGFTVDFKGSDRQALGPINASLAVSMASSFCALTAVVDAYTPLNQGVFDLVDVIAPEGSVVNPTYPAPLYGGNCDTAARIFEAVVKAFAGSMPERVMSGHVASGMNTTAWGQEPESRNEFAWYMFPSGGWGARASKDGNNDVFHAMGNCMNQPVEVWETRHPTRIEKCELRTDSGGAGRFRGGLGIERHLRMLAKETLVSALADGCAQQPFGLDGGQPGSSNAFELIRAADGPRSLREAYDLPSWGKFSNVPLQQDDILSIKCAGGGGFGSPEERDFEALEWDVLNGYVSPEAALDEYRVCIDDSTGKVDREKTEELRSRSTRR